MQHVLQTGLAAGLSAVSGFHSNKPNAVPKDHDHTQDLTPSSDIPRPFPEGRVTYRGKNHNVDAPRVCIGSWSWGDTATWHWDDAELPAVKEAWKLLRKGGLNMIDNAQVYGSGESERICAQLFEGLKREEFIIQTKWW